MPSSTDRQKRFFGAVMGAKKGLKNVSGKAKEVAHSMSESKIKDYLKVAYAQGFIDKCAARNVDPEILAKSAQQPAPAQPAAKPAPAQAPVPMPRMATNVMGGSPVMSPTGKASLAKAPLANKQI